MTRISVVVPTADRPDLLRTTLASIARQSALALVEEVIVSENLGSLETAAVCEEFPEIPITFVMQDPPLDSFEHFARILTMARSEYVAIVCDDDWWTPGHLATAIRNLDREPSASAHVSCYVAAASEFPSTGVFWGLGAIWLAAGRPDPIEPYVLDLAQVLALAWAFTPFSFTTLVARREALPKSLQEMLQSPHTYYEDRMLFTALAKHGPIVYEPLVDTYYRAHAGGWERGKDPEFIQTLLRQCSDYVMGLARDVGVDPPALWREYLTDVPPGVLSDVSDVFRNQLGAELLAEHDLERLLTPLEVPPPPPFARRVVSGLKRRLWRGWR